MLVDVEGYARIFPPTERVTILEAGDDFQVVRLVVSVNGELNTWVSRRDIDAELHVISYRQLETAPLVGSMSGQWRAFPFSTADLDAVKVESERLAVAPGMATR